MRNYAKKNSVLGHTLLATATLSLIALVSCASTGIADLYMSPDPDGARNQSVFFAGEPVSCILKMNSGRLDETLLVSFRPLEANGEVLDLPAMLITNSAPGKMNGIVATPFPAPAVVAYTNTTADLVTFADCNSADPQSQTGLLKEIRAKLIKHMADGNVHKLPDLSGMNPPLPPDSGNFADALVEAELIRALFIAHIGSTMFHDFPDERDVPIAPIPDPMEPAPKPQDALTTELNELKKKVNAHMQTIVQQPAQTAGKYRCEIQLADEKKSIDFVILPGGIAEPPPDTLTPRVGMCNGDPVANCVDPMKGPNILRCCTSANACGTGPKGTPFCY